MGISVTENTEKISEALNSIMSDFLEACAKLNDYPEARQLFAYNMARDISGVVDAASAIIESNMTTAHAHLKQGSLFDD